MLVPQLQQWSKQLCCWGWVGLLPAASRFSRCVALAGPSSSGTLSILPLSG